MKGNGGSAFPLAEQRSPHGEVYMDASAGMTLRDYFAAKAMAAMLRADTDNGRYRGDDITERTASFAYQLADAMLAERDKP